MAMQGTVYVVDDDEGIRRALRMLIEETELAVETYPSAEEFLAHYATDGPACLVLDLNMPGLNGLDLQERLTATGIEIPIIMMTGYGSVPDAVRALQGGAIDFIEKPYKPSALLELVRKGVARDAARREVAGARHALEQLAESLTPREREIMAMIVAGKANKVIAIELGISERTVELHRSRIMHKMKVRSVAELARVALSLERNALNSKD